jgi:nicotinamidase/pyrazinamidase
MEMPLAEKNTPQDGDALLIVDLQRDFLANGSLAVPHGDAVIAPVNAWIAQFTAAQRPILASRDWHPADHCSFRDQGGIWPAHCVAGSPGAQFPDALALPAEARVVSKATQRDADAYSGFDGTDLHDMLRRLDVRQLFVGGLASDYCVLNTVLDALRLGYRVRLLLDCIRPVDVRSGDGERAIAAMVAAGAVAEGATVQ